ncbi:MAG: hypothetical protein HC853_05710 [Anaerolineae bacterium]|nr:hypothetical protein [Anaerolineae bacterium]
MTGEAPPSAVLTKAAQALDRDMREQDWANLYWFDGFDDRDMAVVNANRHFAGLVGYVRLATKANDANGRALGMALLAKATALRVGMAKYPRYLYSAGLTDLPSEADWLVKQTAQVWRGYLYVNNWTGANDDPRQIAMLNQFRTYLHDQSGTSGNNENDCCFTDSHLIAYRDLTPELARLLSDKAKADAEIYARKVKALFPHWYAAFAEGTLGHEHNLSHPVDSYQTFLAEAWLNGNAVNANDLAYYADISLAGVWRPVLHAQAGRACALTVAGCGRRANRH